MTGNNPQDMRKRIRSDRSRLEFLKNLHKIGVIEVTFDKNELVSVKFSQESMEKPVKVRQDKPKELSEEDRHKKEALKNLKRAEFFDNLMIEDPISYEEEMIKEGANDGGFE